MNKSFRVSMPKQKTLKTKKKANPALLPQNGFSLFGGVKKQHVNRFVRQLATLIQMRLPLDRSMTIVVEQTEHQRFKSVLAECKQRVERGQDLAGALAAWPRLFPESLIKFVSMGEITGRLGDTLDRAATQLEKMARLRRKLLTALSYPAVILVVAAGAIGFLLTVVVPTFSEVFSDFGSKLPAATQILVDIGDFLTRRWYVLLAVILITGLLFRKMWASPALRTKMEKLLWRIPVLGGILSKEQLCRFTRTLGTLLENGILLPAALKTAGSTSGSLLISCSSCRIVDLVESGISFSRALSMEGIYPPMLVQMVRVGEEAGTLDRMLEKTAGYYESEIDAAIETLNVILEPLLIVGLGIVLGAILVAMYMQIFNVVDVIG